MSSLLDYLKAMPNSISGDGKSFVSALKNALLSYQSTMDEYQSSSSDGGCEQASNITLTESHDTDSNGMPRNNILVSFSNANITNYSSAAIWVKIGDGEWAQTGQTSGTSYTIVGVTKGSVYYIRVVAINTSGGSATLDKAVIASIAIAGAMITPTTPEQFTVVWNQNGAHWQWVCDEDVYFDYYELRLDSSAGSDTNLLDRVRVKNSAASPGIRAGTAYLFQRNMFGDYGTAMQHQFNKPIPEKPAAPVIETAFQGIKITMDALPADCTGYHVMVNGSKYFSTNSVFMYYQLSGTSTVRYCFVDPLGEGEYSEAVTKDVVIQLAGDQLHVNGDTVLDDDIIGSNNLQANSVIAGKISANTIGTRELAAHSIDLSGALTIVGGAVTLSEAGLKTVCSNGSYVMHDGNGMSFHDSGGNSFSAVGRLMFGYANDGQRVKFSNPWDVAPTVMVFPQNIQTTDLNYSNSNIVLQVGATNVDNTGFTIFCKTVVKGGASGSTNMNSQFMFAKIATQLTTSGSYTFYPPSSATSATFGVRLGATGYTTYSYDSNTGSEYSYPTRVKVYAQWFVNGNAVTGNDLKVDITGGTTTQDVYQYVTFDQGSTVSCTVTVVIGAGNNKSGGEVTAWALFQHYNADNDTVVSTGSACFIVTDSANALYTLE